MSKIARIASGYVIQVYTKGDIDDLRSEYPGSQLEVVDDYVEAGQIYPYPEILGQLDELREAEIKKYEKTWGNASVRLLWPLLQEEITLDATLGENVTTDLFPSIKGFIFVKDNKPIADITIADIRAACSYLRQFRILHTAVLVKTEGIRQFILQTYEALPTSDKLSFDVEEAWSTYYSQPQIW